MSLNIGFLEGFKDSYAITSAGGTGYGDDQSIGNAHPFDGIWNGALLLGAAGVASYANGVSENT